MIYGSDVQFAPTEVEFVDTTGIPQFDDKVVQDVIKMDLGVQQQELARLENNITKLGEIEDEVLGYKVDNTQQKAAYDAVLSDKGLTQNDLLRLDPNDPRAVYEAQRKIKSVMSDPRIQNIEREKQIAAGVAKQYADGKMNMTPGMQTQFLKDFEDYKLGNKSAMDLNPGNYKYVDYNTSVDKLLTDLEPEITASVENLPGGGTYTKEVETLSKDRITRYLAQAMQNPQFRNSLIADGIIEVADDGTVKVTPQGEVYIQSKAEVFSRTKQDIGDVKPLTEAQRKSELTPEEIAAEKTKQAKDVKDTYVKDITSKIKGAGSGEVVTAVNLLYDNYDLKLDTAQAAELQKQINNRGKTESASDVADRYAAQLYVQDLPKAERDDLAIRGASEVALNRFGAEERFEELGTPRIEGSNVVIPVVTDKATMIGELFDGGVNTREETIPISQAMASPTVKNEVNQHYTNKAAERVRTNERNLERIRNTAKDLRGLVSSGEGSPLSYNRGVAGDTSATLPDGIAVGEIMSRQSLDTSDPNRIFAVGSYQIIPSTMNEAVSALGIDRSQPFTQEIQDQIFDYLVTVKRPEIGAYILGQDADLDAALLELAKEFASVGVPYDVKNNKGVLIKKGNSYYSGQKGNKASISPEEAKAMLKKEREQKAGGATDQGFGELKAFQDRINKEKAAKEESPLDKIPTTVKDSLKQAYQNVQW